VKGVEAITLKAGMRRKWKRRMKQELNVRRRQRRTGRRGR